MKHKNWLIAFCSLVLAVVLVVGGRRLVAETAVSAPDTPAAPAVAPSVISFQGFLTDSGGEPVADGSYPMQFGLYSASSGGSAIWAESHGSVAVSQGYFAVLLGSGACTTGCPLDVADFSSATRYLQSSVDTGSGFVTFPRQQLAAVPYAMQADVAASAPWSGLTGVPAGFADGSDNTGVAYDNVLTVAKSGGDYSSVAAALNSIGDASASNPYLVRVMPGVYTETELVTVKAYVHVQGSGPLVTVISSARTGASPNNGAATVELLDNGRISQITVRNTSTGTFGIALYSTLSTRTAVVDGVVAEAIGAGGVGHYAAYWNDAEATIRNSKLVASGATGFGTGVNAGLGIVNISGGFPQPLISNSQLLGGNGNSDGLSCAGNSGTGFAIQGTNAAVQVFDSYLCGDRRGIFLGTNGQTRLHNSQLWGSSTSGSFLVETTASAAVILVNSGVFYATDKHTGSGGLTCVNSYKANYTPASDGTTPATACN
ncbi:MAG: hypothetical protein IT327_04455 [Anaerolineae bacterium]|nr:hypothetical protein [Anaerolineae bacterium]